MSINSTQSFANGSDYGTQQQPYTTDSKRVVEVVVSSVSSEQTPSHEGLGQRTDLSSSQIDGTDSPTAESQKVLSDEALPSSSVASVASSSVLAHNAAAMASPLMFDDSSSSDDSDSGHKEEDTEDTNHDHSSCVEVDVDAVLESGGRGTTDFEFQGGGLGRCLLEMDSVTTAYQKRYFFRLLFSTSHY